MKRNQKETGIVMEWMIWIECNEIASWWIFVHQENAIKVMKEKNHESEMKPMSNSISFMNLISLMKVLKTFSFTYSQSYWFQCWPFSDDCLLTIIDISIYPSKYEAKFYEFESGKLE